MLTWVADHRRHHKYSDREGDPHSPWRFGTDWQALTKGLAFAHIGWLFDEQPHLAGEVLPRPAGRPEDRAGSPSAVPGLVVVSLLAPALIGGLWSMSWQGALTAFFWGSLVRIAFLHHVTWSINSICHTFGKEEFEVRDKSRNVNWLAILSFGESWHNLHHADPTCARHGALQGPDRHRRPAHLVLREARLGLRRALAGHRPADREVHRRDAQARRHGPAQRQDHGRGQRRIRRLRTPRP